MFAVSFVVAPAVSKSTDSPGETATLIASVTGRFQRISRELIFAILLTGIFNVLHAGLLREFHFGAKYLGALFLKIALFLTIIVVQLWQSYRLTPALTSAATDLERTRLQRRAMAMASVNLVLAVVAIFLGLKLRYSL